jgi:hypothetical protein
MSEVEAARAYAGARPTRASSGRSQPSECFPACRELRVARYPTPGPQVASDVGASLISVGANLTLVGAILILVGARNSRLSVHGASL